MGFDRGRGGAGEPAFDPVEDDISVRAGHVANASPQGEAPRVEDTTRQKLEGLFASARERWPDVDVPEPVFLDYLLDRIPSRVARFEGLAQLRSVDLYLACACARGSGVALRHFERKIVPNLAAALMRMNFSAPIVDEAVQRLRLWLFVAEPGQRPGIEDYAGRGDLRGWLRVVAARMATQVIREQGRTVQLDDIGSH